MKYDKFVYKYRMKAIFILKTKKYITYFILGNGAVFLKWVNTK